MEPRISILTLGVGDLTRSIAFYRDGLGLPLQDGPDGIAFFELGSLLLALYPRHALAEDACVPEAGSGFRAVTIAHCVRSKPEVERVLAEAVRAGATLLKPAQDVFWGGYSGYFADIDGHLWEVAWAPGMKIE